MLRSLAVDQLGLRIGMTDRLLLRLLAHRMGLAVSVGARKRADKQEIYRRDTENKRIDALRIEGRKLGLNESFVEAVIYLVIGEACKQQMIRLQKEQDPLPNTTSDDEWYDICKQNLLALTAQVAGSYDQDYDLAFSASSAYRAYEDGVINEQVAKLPKRGLAVDLGCATGRQALRLADKFESVVGFDLSPAMIEQADKNKFAKNIGNATFKVADLEQGIPLPDGSASFVFANFGVASDLRNIQAVIVEIERVLEPRGRYLLSFYNKDALVYRWEFFPWPVGLAAEINEKLGCLDVHAGDKTFLVYAKTYTPSEVRTMLSAGALKGPSVVTFPTISSILPSLLLLEGGDKAKDTITMLDRALEISGHGAYTIATGEKICNGSCAVCRPGLVCLSGPVFYDCFERIQYGISLETEENRPRVLLYRGLSLTYPLNACLP